MIEFLSKSDTNQLLQSNEDRYYNTFFQIDFLVRGVGNIKQYKDKIKDAGCSFTATEKQQIRKSVKMIDQVLAGLSQEWFDGKKASLINWKIGCIDDTYEEGFPHTRKTKEGVVILLSKKNIDKRTLLHEKIHVYQKMYPKDVKKYLRLKKIKKTGKRKEGHRANPDVDSFLYEGFDSSYISNPKSINDILYSQYYEHPFERMAKEL